MYSDYEDQVSDFLEFFGIFLFLVLIYMIKLKRNFRGSRFRIESKLINGFAFFRDPRKYGLSAIPIGKFVSNDVLQLNGSIIQLPEILIIINLNIISPLMGFIEISFNEKLKREKERELVSDLIILIFRNQSG